MALGCQQGLGVCGHGCMVGLKSGRLLERKCEEKGRTKSAKEKLWEACKSFLGPFWKKRAEKESTGPKSAFRRFSEVPSTTKSTVFFRCWLSWGPSGEVDGKRLAEPSEVNWRVRRTNKAIYSLTPGLSVKCAGEFWEHLGGALGSRFGVFYFGKTINS